MKLFAFIKKDLLIKISYRFNFILQYGRIAISLLMFYFIGMTFGGVISPHLKQYGGDYFSYALIGMAVSSFVSVGLNTIASEVRSAQMQGTLEALLGTPTSIYYILVGNSLWSFIEALLGTLVMLIFGILVLNLPVTLSNSLAALLVLLLTFISFLSIGILSASFIMIFKQGNPIGMIFGTSSYFLGGVIFPVEVLPSSLQYLSVFLPITHAVKALRNLLLAQMDFYSIIPLLINLLIFIAILSPLSILFFRYSINRARLNGSLVQY